MGEKLAKPPVIEAICEFRFAETAPWEWTIPGQLYDKIGQEFADRSQLQGMGVQIKASQSAPPIATIQPAPNRVQLKRQDGSAMVQIGPHLLAINHLKPYPEWETFRLLITRIFDQYRSITGDAPLERIGLRYINEIAVPDYPFDIGSYITLDPPLTGALDRPLRSAYQRYELEEEQPVGALIHQSGIRREEGKTAIILDLDFGSTMANQTRATDEIRDWLDAAHDRIYESFVASLNPEMYEKLRKG